MLSNTNFNYCSGDIERKIAAEEAFNSVDQDYEAGKIQEKDLLKEQQKRLQAKGLYPEAANVLRYRHKMAAYYKESTENLPDPEQYLAQAEAYRAAGMSVKQINEQLKEE